MTFTELLETCKLRLVFNSGKWSLETKYRSTCRIIGCGYAQGETLAALFENVRGKTLDAGGEMIKIYKHLQFDVPL